MGKKTVAELLVDTLVSREVSRIYGSRETRSTGSPIPSGDRTSFDGSTRDTRRLRPSPRAPRRTSPGVSLPAPAAAARVTCT